MENSERNSHDTAREEVARMFRFEEVLSLADMYKRVLEQVRTQGGLCILTDYFEVFKRNRDALAVELGLPATSSWEEIARTLKAQLHGDHLREIGLDEDASNAEWAQGIRRWANTRLGFEVSTPWTAIRSALPDQELAWKCIATVRINPEGDTRVLFQLNRWPAFRDYLNNLQD